MSVKWKMIDRKTFTGECNGYTISIKMGAAIGMPYWAIIKDGNVIDECFHHLPVSGELNAKVQSERVLNKLLNSEQSVKESDTTNDK